MSKVLSEGKKRKLSHWESSDGLYGALSKPLAATVRRETASAYLKAAGIAVRLPRFWGKRTHAKPTKEVPPTFKSHVKIDQNQR